LFDFNADRSEALSKNQASANPDIVKSLAEEWTAWAKRVGVSEVIPGYTRSGQKGKDKAGDNKPED
jgi:hypothetical protein